MKENEVSCLTPDARALMGDVVLQFGPEARFSSSAADTPIIHQQEGLVVVIQAAGISRRVLDVVFSRKAALYIKYFDCNEVKLCNCTFIPIRWIDQASAGLTWGLTSCCRFGTIPQGAMPSATTLFRETDEAAVAWSLTASPTHLPTPSRKPGVIIHAPGRESCRIHV